AGNESCDPSEIQQQKAEPGIRQASLQNAPSGGKPIRTTEALPQHRDPIREAGSELQIPGVLGVHDHLDQDRKIMQLAELRTRPKWSLARRPAWLLREDVDVADSDTRGDCRIPRAYRIERGNSPCC